MGGAGVLFGGGFNWGGGGGGGGGQGVFFLGGTRVSGQGVFS